MINYQLLKGQQLHTREQHLSVETPSAMRTRLVDHRGFPVPWFVTGKTPDGKWDFVNISRDRMLEAVRTGKCWVSGQRLGSHRAFCVGPMCVINRTAGDPPVTRDIALWSVRVYPFMSRPRARRSHHNETEISDRAGIDGVAILRNPGVTAVWVTRNSEYQLGRGFYLGDPFEITWWCEGRPATRAEVMASVESGIHHLEKLAVEEGPSAVAALALAKIRAEPLWPIE